tara:strand:+ start:121 stop:363 length:243 start_codon:yes stop_codon:yes gene_type:complete
MTNDEILKHLEEIKQNQVELLEIISEISDDVLDLKDSFDEMKDQTAMVMNEESPLAGVMDTILGGLTEAMENAEFEEDKL